METKTVFCKVPLITISVSAIICNIAIIIFQHRKNIINGRIRYFLFSLVAIDLIYSSFVILMIIISVTQSTSSNNTPRHKTIDATFRSLAISFIHIQLFTQTAIAVERFIAAKFPIVYRNSLSKVNRKIVIVGLWIGSLSLSTAITFPAILYDYPRVVMIICGIIYTLSMILVVTMYLLMTIQIRKGNRRITMRDQDNPGGDQSRRRERERRQERNTIVLSVTIVVTYFVLNTTLVVYASFFDEGTESTPIAARSCDTNNGIFANIAFGLAVFNRAFDPILYYYLWYRLNKRVTKHTDTDARQEEVAAVAKSNNRVIDSTAL